MPGFIGVPITPHFVGDSVVQNRTTLEAFTWSGRRFIVTAILRRWQEKSPPRFRRRGRSNRWHISPFGRDYYRVRTADGRIFDLYYDRRPGGRGTRGRWILWRELDEPGLPGGR